jgi:hypothetical protein
MNRIRITGERKPRASQGSANCAQVGHGHCRRAERKATASPQMTCAQVGVADSPGGLNGEPPHVITIRNDTPALAGPPAQFTPDEWEAFIDGAKRGEFDLDPVTRLLPPMHGQVNDAGEAELPGRAERMPSADIPF